MFRTRLSLERLENREAPSGIDPVNPLDPRPAPAAPGPDVADRPGPADHRSLTHPHTILSTGHGARLRGPFHLRGRHPLPNPGRQDACLTCPRTSPCLVLSPLLVQPCRPPAAGGGSSSL